MDKKLVQTYAALVAITIIGLLLIKELNISYPLDVRTSPRSSELSVVGEGKIEAVPDTASVTVGISVNNVATVAEAESRINEVNNKIITSMDEIGIKKTDIKTSNYSIYPSYSPESQDKISSYSGNVSVTIQTSQIDKVSDIVTPVSYTHLDVYKRQLRGSVVFFVTHTPRTGGVFCCHSLMAEHNNMGSTPIGNLVLRHPVARYKRTERR